MPRYLVQRSFPEAGEMKTLTQLRRDSRVV